jgi:acyl dehydratase
MALDPQALLRRSFAPIQHRFTTRDTMLYALGAGLGSDPLDRGQLRYVYEDGLTALPTFANVLAYPGFWVRECDAGIDWKRLLHAEQAIELHAPLPVEGLVVGRNRVSGLWNKGAAKGTLMQQVRELEDAAGLPLATVTQLTLLRGDGGCGSAGEGAPPAPHSLPERSADVVCDLPTLAQSALIYRLSGDYNPLHADPAVATAAGFARPILHGMCTMGVAAHAVLRTVLDYDAARFAAMRVRFTAAVFPGDTLRTELWVDGDVVSLRTTAFERGVLVLDKGRVDVRPGNVH